MTSASPPPRHAADQRDGRLPAGRRHLPAAPSEDRPLEPRGGLPTFTAEAIRQRLSVLADRSPEALVFHSREGTPLTTANVRRQLRRLLGDAGIEGVHPHMFRRTVATVVNDQASVNLAAELLGHTDPKVTIEHYIRRDEHVNPLTAELLESSWARRFTT